MPPKSKYALGKNRKSANKVFTNREKPIASFNQARASITEGEHHLLTYYGVGGQGKTALCEKLIDTLKQEKPQTAIWGNVNFEVSANRRADRTLLALRKALVSSSKGKIKFPAFEVAITHYWELEYPENNIKDSLKDLFDRSESYVGSIVDNSRSWLGFTEELPAGMGLGIKLLNYLRNKRTEQKLKKTLEALKGLELLSNHELLQKLPYIFATDIASYLAQEGALTPVLFIDTYEALWADYPVKNGIGTTEADAWVRSLVAELPSVLFVILGRNKLTWDKDFPNDWQGDLNNQHLLGGLSDQDADSYLRNIPIDDTEIRQTLIAGAQGKASTEAVQDGETQTGAHPFYLDLAVDLYLDILDDDKQPTTTDFGHTPAELLDRFIRYRSTEEIQTLKVLSVADGFDQALFESLVKTFSTGYPLTAFSEFLQ